MTVVIISGAVLAGELVLAFGLSALRWSRMARRISNALCRAPLLDGLIALMTIVPPVVGAAIDSWRGLLAALLGQLLTIPVWVIIHERLHRSIARGPRLGNAQNAIAGRWRNHAALWFSITALPILWVVRIGEILLYPPLRWLLGFPKYNHGEWINVSRHKFEGLVGHDLIWCLYCDWMTGIQALSGEMLRNVESFWCPIRFYDGKKCENCRVDFPDIDQWESADPTVARAVELIEREYANGRREWFGHSARLTINGDSLSSGSRHDS